MDIARLDHIIARCNWRQIADEFIASEIDGVEPDQFCNEFSNRVAHEYHAGRLSFEDADCAMNHLFAFAFSNLPHGLPEYAMDVFLAFDDGEFHHSGDSDDVTPEDKYTRPQIQAIMDRELAK